MMNARASLTLGRTRFGFGITEIDEQMLGISAQFYVRFTYGSW